MSDYDALRESLLTHVDRQLQTFKERDRDITSQQEKLRAQSEELEQKAEKLEQQKSELEKEKAQMGQLEVSDNDVVELNVQGELISTLRGTLCQVSSFKVSQARQSVVCTASDGKVHCTNLDCLRSLEEICTTSTRLTHLHALEQSLL